MTLDFDDNHREDESKPLLSYSRASGQGSTSINRQRYDPETSDRLSLVSTASSVATSVPAAIFLTVNAALGAGLLNFPFAFSQAGGFTPAFIAQFSLLILIVGALFILCYCVDISGCSSFQDLIECFCGKSWKSFTSIAIILYSYGACLTFIIVIGDQADRVFASIYGNDFCHKWFLNRTFTMTTLSILFILPLCFSKAIDFLKYASSAGVLVVSYIVFLSYYEWLTVDRKDIVIEERKWLDVIRVFPAVCFGYQCHLTWVPTYAGMNVKTSSSKNIVTIAISLFITTIVYNIVTIFGLLTFGSRIEGDLMVNYDASNVMVLIGIMIVAFKAVLTYPPVLFCARLAVDDLVVNVTSGLSNASEKYRRVTIVLVWFLSNIVLAIYVPDISSTIDVTGTLAILFIFILPGIVLIYAVTDNRVNTTSRTKYYLLATTGISYVLIGTFIFGVTVTQVIMKDFTQGSKSVPIHLCT